MKRLTLILATSLVLGVAAKAQSGQTQENKEEEDKKVYWSAFFGLFGNAKKSDSVKVKPVDFDFAFDYEHNYAQVDIDSAERRSLLWGAIQYSVKPEADSKKHKQGKQ